MGALLAHCSKWFDTEKCMGTQWSEQNYSSLEKKLQAIEQRMVTLEQRVNTTEEANQRLHNKFNGWDERLHQHENLQNGHHHIVMTRLRSVEQRVENMSFDHCERLDDDIIVVEER
jgi:predicted  nucleic acid-binding Zn-ribbon protein